MSKEEIVAILQGLHPKITKCKLNMVEYIRWADGWYESDEFVCGWE